VKLTEAPSRFVNVLPAANFKPLDGPEPMILPALVRVPKPTNVPELVSVVVVSIVLLLAKTQ
jgi:hypothetical protein